MILERLCINVSDKYLLSMSLDFSENLTDHFSVFSLDLDKNIAILSFKVVFRILVQGIDKCV